MHSFGTDQIMGSSFKRLICFTTGLEQYLTSVLDLFLPLATSQRRFSLDVLLFLGLELSRGSKPRLGSRIWQRDINYLKVRGQRRKFGS